MTEKLTHLIKDGRSGLWWRQNKCGYTNDVCEAGLYTEAEAMRIASKPGDDRRDQPVPLANFQAEADHIVRAALAFRWAVRSAVAKDQPSSEQEDREMDPIHAALRRRSERLVRLLELRVPKSIIGHEIELIVRAGLIYCGPEQQAAFIQWIVGQSRHSHGLCPLCSRAIENRSQPWCGTCEAAFKAEDAAMEVPH